MSLCGPIKSPRPSIPLSRRCRYSRTTRPIITTSRFHSWWLAILSEPKRRRAAPTISRRKTPTYNIFSTFCRLLQKSGMARRTPREVRTRALLPGSRTGLPLQPVVPLFAGTAVVRGAGEDLAPVGEGNVARVGQFAAVLRKVSFDAHGVTRLEGVSGPAAPHETIWAAEFKLPVGHLAGFIGYVDIETGMRILPLHLRDRAFERYRLARVVLSRKGVMRQDRHSPESQQDA